MQSLSDLVQSSTFIFSGTVLERGASSVPFVPPNEKLITARLDKSLRTDPMLGDLRGQTITVEVGGSEQFTAGQKVLFFANSWVHGRGIAVREVAHLDPTQADRVAAAVAELPQRHLLDRLQDAEAVVDAKITSIDPPGFTLDQHDGLWAAAQITVSATLKGSAPRQVLLRDGRVAAVEPGAAIQKGPSGHLHPAYAGAWGRQRRRDVARGQPGRC